MVNHRSGEISRGFSLIELLCVVLIIGLLAGLTLPAVQRARESSRRLQCHNHLKQIGLALHSYASVHAYFPAINSPSGHSAGKPLPYSAHHYSPLARMLDHLDNAPAYHAINFTLPPYLGQSLQDNLTVMSLRIDSFCCPSDPQDSPGGYGRVNYRFNIGPTPWNTPGLDYPETYSGPFSTHRFYRPADFADGLSQTIGASERVQGDWLKSRFAPGDYYLTMVCTDKHFADADWAVSVCRAVPAGSPHESRSGESWFLSGFHFTNYNHSQTPNARFADCSVCPITPQPATESIHDRQQKEGVFTARSGHPGGVNVLLMDGSVRFLGDSINLAVWRAFATRSGGEVISTP